MSKHAAIIVSCACGLVIVGAVTVYFAAMQYVERLRDHDEDRAFRPIMSLGVTVYSNPVAFHRFCIYCLEFPPWCKLSDANTSELTSLNTLPEEYELDLVIRTPQVTDCSLPQLEAIRHLDLLDVTESGISDEGIARLKKSHPRATVCERESKAVNSPKP